MKQKIVIMLCVPCDKCRTKAMERAARQTGVISVAITGDYADRLEVVGEDVDLVCLVGCLRRKVGRAVILHVEEVKPKKPEEKKPEEKKPEEKKPIEPAVLIAPPLPQCHPGCSCSHCPPVPQCHPGWYHYPPVPQVAIYDEYGACSIM